MKIFRMDGGGVGVGARRGRVWGLGGEEGVSVTYLNPFVRINIDNKFIDKYINTSKL